ncbi:hypothetical protein Hdeb2414_s0004g00150641 [Helianthus debilis subsp. tardiflorus]
MWKLNALIGISYPKELNRSSFNEIIKNGPENGTQQPLNYAGHSTSKLAFFSTLDDACKSECKEPNTSLLRRSCSCCC